MKTNFEVLDWIGLTFNKGFLYNTTNMFFVFRHVASLFFLGGGGEEGQPYQRFWQAKKKSGKKGKQFSPNFKILVLEGLGCNFKIYSKVNFLN